MINIKEILDNASYEVKTMLKNSDEKDFVMRIQLRTMQKNIERLEKIINTHDKIKSRLRGHVK